MRAVSTRGQFGGHKEIKGLGVGVRFVLGIEEGWERAR